MVCGVLKTGNIKDKDMYKEKVNFVISKEKLQCGLKNYSTNITT